jgi:hypothetical protein
MGQRMHSWKEEMDIKIWFELLEIPESVWAFGLAHGVSNEPPHYGIRSRHSRRSVQK